MMQKVFSLFIILYLSITAYSQAPTANFTATPTTACVGEDITFTSTSTAGGAPINKYDWDFGDGNHGTNSSVSHHSYNAPGNYIIILVVTDQNNNADAEVKTNYITITANPTADFIIQTGGCTVPSTINFINQSTSGLTYSWNFGNTQTSTNENPSSVTYNTAGNYTIKLDVTNSSTNCKASVTKSVSISNFKTDFNLPDSICVGNFVNLTDNSTVGANSWTWTCSDGQTSNIQNTNFAFFIPGTYTVTLNSANTTSNCNDSKSKDIVVVPLPSPSFSANTTSGCKPLAVTFTNTTTSGKNYQWTFGDGTTYNGQTPPIHSYTNYGAFDVSLTTTGVFGCTNTTTFPNYIITKPAVADFIGVDTNGCTPLKVNFTDLSTAANATDDPITTWTWTFGNGATYNGQTPPQQTYNTGIYSVSLTITTQKGCTDTETKTNYIQVGKIDLVNYSYTPPIQCAKTPIHFTDHSVISAPHNPNEVTYDWDFGEPGGKSSQQNPDYSYSNDTGYFDVQFIVTFRGCKDTMKIDSAVFIKAPISKFSPAQTLYCNPSSFPVKVDVTDNAIIGKASDDVKMIWRWGDAGNTNTVLEDPDLDPDDDGSSSFNYSTYGTYTIKQVVYDYTTGCQDSTTNTIVISRTTADFTMSNDSICKNGIATFTDNSNSVDNLVSYIFDFGDGTAAFGTPVSHQFLTAGAINITLTVTNDKNCSAIKSQTLNVLELPNANLTPSASAGCAPITVTYTNSSTPQGNGYSKNPVFANFLWTFPNGTTTTTNNINTTKTYNFTTEGNFKTTLIATDNFGCVSLPTDIPMMITKPTPNFIIDSVVCNKTIIQTINNSSGYGNLTYDWKIDNISSSSAIDFGHTFNENSNVISNNIPHAIKLTVTDGNGCVNTLTKNIKVSLPHAKLNYSFSGANQNSNGGFTCPPVFGTYINQSNVYGNIYGSSWDFGDGKHSTLKDPSNTYVFSGTYSMSLRIQDAFGCKDTVEYKDYLTINGPIAKTNISDLGDPCKQLFQFDTLNSSDIDHIVWNFGDGDTSKTIPVQHAYNQSGTYYPTLSIYDNNNCEVQYKDTVVILINGLNAHFTATPTTADIGTPIVFTDNSTYNSPIDTWKWEFGDYLNSSITNITNANTDFTYVVPSYYTVKLTVTDANGCTDEYTTIIHITGSVEVPNVFTPNGDGNNDSFDFPFDIFKSYDVLILDRWGSVVYNKKNVTGTKIWNGTNMDKQECTEGVYFYKITGIIKDGTPFEKSGFLTKI